MYHFRIWIQNFKKSAPGDTVIYSPSYWQIWSMFAMVVGGWDFGLCVVFNLFYDCAAKSIMSVMVVHSFVVCIYIIYRICDFFSPSIQITRYLSLRNSIYKSRDFNWFWHKITQNGWNELLVLIAKKKHKKRRLKFW